jgi:hypothetical protein
MVPSGVYSVVLEASRVWCAFRTEFVAFGREKRSAMNTLAVSGNLKEETEHVSDLLPGLKRLWFDVDFGSYH